jgi:hypothetical protein
MMRATGKLFILALLILSSCAPKVTTRLSTMAPSSERYPDIRVYKIEDKTPADATILGTVKVGDSGFSSNCGFFEVLDKAIEQAKLSGGNAIKIIRHILPGRSTCHRITALILKINDPDKKVINEVEAKSAGYAVLNIFGDPDTSNPFCYDLYLEDKLFCNVKNGSKIIKAINNQGIHAFSVKPDSSVTLKVDIKPGEVYYLRCGSIKKDSLNWPLIQIVDKNEGIKYFDMFSNPE